MAPSRWAQHVWRHVALAALFWTLAAAEGPSFPILYCAGLNTAEMPANFSIYQSEGLCHDFCRNKYALAVVHVNDCWCTDLVPPPKSQVSTDKCTNPCPGFPDDLCGGNGLFGYIALNKRPSGTASTGTTSSTTRVPNPGKSDSPIVSTVTADGTVRTVTVGPTAGSNSDNLSPASKKLSTGAAVGVAVAVVAVVIALAAGIVFFFIKRRRQRRAEEQGDYDAPSHRGSSSGMMGTPKTGEMSENRYVGGSDGRAMSENWESTTQGKRRSTLMPIDPRMDPSTKGIYHRPENKSHESITSLRDDQDYSRRVHEPPRVLRAMNPDPDVN